MSSPIRPPLPTPAQLPIRHRGLARLTVVPVAVLVALVLAAIPALANVALTQIGADPFTNATSQHQTQVEPDTFQFGSTIVAVTQTGRFFDGGSSGIAFATSTNNGATWTTGVLPGITTFQGGPYNRVSDPVITYDARHNVWLANSLAISESGGVHGVGDIVSRSTDGGLTWSNPVLINAGSDPDKNWIVCDNTATSPFYGNCYAEWDNHGQGNLIKMSRSTNGGTSWGAALNTGDSATGLGGQPVVRPNGTVIVPIANANTTQIRSFRSIDGGASWRATVLISAVQQHTVAGGLRTSPLPSAEIDSAGTVYVAWQDCRFQSGCTGNDIVLATSTSETTWGAVTRITSDGGDHFIPGIGVDRTTSGGTTRVAVTYYRYPTSSCTAATCQLTVGYTSSTNGGASWRAPTQITGPITLAWVSNTNQGRMVGDYISTSVIPGGNAYPAISSATANSGTTFFQHMYTITGGQPVLAAGASVRAAETPVATGEAVPDTPKTAR